MSEAAEVVRRPGVDRTRRLGLVLTGRFGHLPFFGEAAGHPLHRAHGLIRSANAAVGTIFGYDPADLVGRDIALLIPAGERPQIEAAVACVRAGGSPGVLLTRSVGETPQ